MKVLVAGGTGALGPPIVRALTGAGHDVVVTSRSGSRSGPAASAGASTVVADLLDATAVDTAVADAAPEVVIHAATALPPAGPQRWSDLEATNALRDKGTAHLVAAAEGHGVRRIVGQSFLGGYAPVTDPAVRLAETAPFGDPGSGPAGLRASTAAMAALERAILGSAVDGVVLRFGFFYGDPAADAAMVAALRQRRIPLPGGAPGVLSYVHVDDAATAVLAAVEDAPAGSTYNIADDEAVSFGDHLRAIADAHGAPRPWSVPRFVGTVAAPAGVEFICKHRPLAVGRAREELGWSAHRHVSPGSTG
jgi:nucleoside-diphosphate-sugar epimerase